VTKREGRDLSERLVAGASLPAPQPVFPRYVEAEDAAAKPA
jgi:hypothetical protein